MADEETDMCEPAEKPSAAMLKQAIRDGDLKAMEALLAQGADANARDIEDIPLLMWALNNKQIVERLLDKGADINAQDRSGYTMLMFATKWGYAEVVRLLVERGADLSHKNNSRETALSIAEESGPFQVKVIDRTEIARILRDAIEQRRLAGIEQKFRTAQSRRSINFSDTNRWIDEVFNPIEKQIGDLLAAGDPLSAIVHAGDVGKARAFFDALFWAGKNRQPQWEHLQLALLTENKPMLRFLAARGASCTAENMGELKQVTAEKYSHYAALLRASGLREPEAVESSAAPVRLKVGDKIPDGTIYAGFSPDTQQPMYVMTVDSPLKITFNEAALLYAPTLDTHGHKDWRVPTKEELNVLYQNKDKGFLKGTFNENRGECWYWSSTPVSEDSKDACNQRFDYGRQGSWFKSERFSVRCVRG